jgi:hypothetical protein
VANKVKEFVDHVQAAQKAAAEAAEGKDADVKPDDKPAGAE